ncbi:MAG TPA: hypothetical protein VK982_05015 [Bacteroidales bacterium]|nr:hypothetical protein [Bacteroidales bacterium]
MKPIFNWLLHYSWIILIVTLVIFAFAFYWVKENPPIETEPDKYNIENHSVFIDNDEFENIILFAQYSYKKDHYNIFFSFIPNVF